MAGLVEGGQEVIGGDNEDAAADLALISAAQRVKHCEIDGAQPGAATGPQSDRQPRLEIAGRRRECGPIAQSSRTLFDAVPKERRKWTGCLWDPSLLTEDNVDAFLGKGSKFAATGTRAAMSLRAINRSAMRESR